MFCAYEQYAEISDNIDEWYHSLIHNDIQFFKNVLDYYLNDVYLNQCNRNKLSFYIYIDYKLL